MTTESAEFKIVNRLGLHARAAAQLVQTANRFISDHPRAARLHPPHRRGARSIERHRGPDPRSRAPAARMRVRAALPERDGGLRR